MEANILVVDDEAEIADLPIRTQYATICPRCRRFENER